MPINLNDVKDPDVGVPVILQITSARVRESKKPGSSVYYYWLNWVVVGGEGAPEGAVGHSGFELVMVGGHSDPVRNATWQREAQKKLSIALGYPIKDLPAHPDEDNIQTTADLPQATFLATLKWQDGGVDYDDRLVIDQWINHVSPEDIPQPSMPSGEYLGADSEGDVL